MATSNDKRQPRLKRKSLRGAPTIDQFLGQVLPERAAKTQRGKRTDADNSGTVAAANCSNVVDHRIREFILDTGASVHIGSKSLLTNPESRLTDLESPMTLESANGPVHVDQYVDSFLPALGCTVALRAAGNTPGALSLGELCRREGFSFVWGRMAKEAPML